MPDRRRSSRTRTLERFIRQFFFWYHVMFYKVRVVQKLFDMLFERLNREDGTRYAASYAVWASRARQWNRVWKISKDARLARIPPIMPEELLGFELFPEITLEELPQPCKMSDVQDQYVPYTTVVTSAIGPRGRPTDIAFNEPAVIAEPVTSEAYYNYSDPWQLPQDFHIIFTQSVQSSSPSAAPETLSEHGCFMKDHELGNSQYHLGGTEEPVGLASAQEPWQHPNAGRHLERYPTWNLWHNDDVAAAGRHGAGPYMTDALGSSISLDTLDGGEVHSTVRDPIRRVPRGRQESNYPTTP